MKIRVIVFLAFVISFTSCSSVKNGKSSSGWISLFDGKSLSGWKAAENPETFKVENGTIVVHGPRAHLFYEGPVNNHNFKNFEFKAQVMTTPGSNSGIFIHTQYQENGWPEKGYEIQVNNSHTDWRRTGSLYAVQDVREVYVKDNEWYTEYIKVQDKHIVIKINDKTVVDYTEPDSISQNSVIQKKLSHGTFALQGHDPNSKVYFKDIFVKPLP
ncbi:3-keto-disaccharide hydrolase [Rubrolithibacter danxiaensis]|uniref:3-keto-disaccharide hydrolase n=1 Tax=Rubrolithibacter danxiaensis TaxID=3390805 RepID=UPI003BF7BB5A